MSRNRKNGQTPVAKIELNLLIGPPREAEEVLDVPKPRRDDGRPRLGSELPVAVGVIAVRVGVSHDKFDRIVVMSLLIATDNLLHDFSQRQISSGSRIGAAVHQKSLYLAQEQIQKRRFVVVALVLSKDVSVLGEGVHLERGVGVGSAVR